ncbi:MAG: hypothetical protein D6698_00110, partial [Gammaproteobacteria bacterium]
MRREPGSLIILAGIWILSSCQNDGTTAVDPIISPVSILYVDRPVPTTQQEKRLYDLRQVFSGMAGGDLFIRGLNGNLDTARNLTGQLTNGQGDVRDVSVSPDGDRVLFSLCQRVPCDPADRNATTTWNIWEYTLSTDSLRRIIAEDITAESAEDLSPVFLPDGRIVFTSTRQKQSRARLLDEGMPQFASLEESRQVQAAVLHIMNEDGTQIRQLSFNPSHDLFPTVLQDGRILFARNDHMGSRNEINLYTIRPDGTELKLVYGAHSHVDTPNTSNPQFLRPREQSNGQILTLIRPFSGTQSGGEIASIDLLNFSDKTLLRPNHFSASSSTQSPVTSLKTSSSPFPPDGRFLDFATIPDDPARLLVSWSPCRKMLGQSVFPCITPDQGIVPSEADPLYSLYLLNRADQTLIPLQIPRPGRMLSDLAVADSFPFQNLLRDKSSGQGLDQALLSVQAGAINIRSVYDMDGKENTLGSIHSTIASLADPAQSTASERPARFLRLVKAVSIPDRNTRRFADTAFGRSRQQLMREIIGYVPIEPDGSVIVKVPANVPFALSIVDRDGKRIGPRHQNWLQVSAGEVLKCNGCHDHGSSSSHGTDTPAPSVYPGALVDQTPFPNTLSSRKAVLGETMAETLLRSNGTFPSPNPDLDFQDIWTDPAVAGRAIDPPLLLTYSVTGTPSPVKGTCSPNWTPGCRIILHYPDHIQPLWDKN